jgi:alginate O-acetyltransferase complex protein AlgI
VIFNSLTFFVFLLIFIPIYWTVSETAKRACLFAAGILFYGFWRIDFVFLLLASITFDFFSALIIASAKSATQKRMFLFASLAINIGLIAFFKYAYFAAENVRGLASLLGVEIAPLALNIVLPIGISFYTFHAMSYVIDVYRGHTRPVRDYLLFCNYVLFFPQLVAGPILRAGEMIWQLEKRPAFDWNQISYGLMRIVAGLFLKVFLADNIAFFVDESYAVDAAALSAWDTLTIAFLFGFQIYFDFSGYSHIAIGVASLMGIRFPENFNFPYLAVNPRQFWRRWHISLSSWIRDYVYLPLAGVKVEDRMSTGGIGIDGTGQAGRRSFAFALFFTWAVMGLWHGAAWTYVVWGLWHAALVWGHRLIGAYLPAGENMILRFVGWGTTLVLVMLAWIPFRANSMDYTLTAWGQLLHPDRYRFLALRETTYLIAAAAFVVVVAAPFVAMTLSKLKLHRPMLHDVVMFPGLVLVMIVCIVYLRPINQFIYFQF